MKIRLKDLAKWHFNITAIKNNLNNTAIENLENHTIIISINKNFNSPQSFDYFGTTFTEIFSGVNSLYSKKDGPFNIYNNSQNI